MKDNILYSYFNGELHFGIKKKNLLDLVKNYQRPFYVYDLTFISRQIELYKKYFPANSSLFYAVKANANPEVLRHIKSRGACVDVVSGGEIMCALAAGFKPEQIIFSGVGKTTREITLAIEKNIFQINVESLPELRRVISICEQVNKTISVAVRINPDISVVTHPYISTGLKENKFGLELIKLPEFADLLKKQTRVQWRGLSIHLGSQIFEVEPLREGLMALLNQILKYQRDFPQLTRVDVGGGLGIDYHDFDFAKEEQMLKLYGDTIQQVFGSKNFQIMAEPGRSIVGHAGVLITQIQYIKSTAQKTFVIVDSGMNHLLRPTLYQAHHQIVPLQISSDLTFECDVVGPICETSDFFAKDCRLPHCKEGDFLAVCDVGAYGYSMASRYNQTDLPDEICLEE